MDGKKISSELINQASGELHNFLLPIGNHTKKFLEENPTVVPHFENVGIRIEGAKMGEYERLVLVFPGLQHTLKDQKKSINGFWESWAKLPLERSFAQITYPDHTFVPGLMYAQVEDMIEHFDVKKIDMVSFSFGGPYMIQQAMDFTRNSMPVDIKTFSFLISGLDGDSLTNAGKNIGFALDNSAKLDALVGIPSTIAPNLRGFAKRAGNIGEQMIDHSLLPNSPRVLMLAAEKDELFNSKKTVKQLMELYPEADVKWLTGGHSWDSKKSEQVGNDVFYFLAKE